MQVFRIVTRTWKHHAFSGDGARLYGGRWNPKGTAVVYTAASRALALLEMLVQDEPLRAAYWVIPATIPDTVHIEQVMRKALPYNWMASTQRETLRTIGQTWITRGKSAVLAVPSAVMPAETNYLLNPLHPDFAQIQIGQAEKLQTDLRLRRRMSVSTNVASHPVGKIDRALYSAPLNPISLVLFSPHPEIPSVPQHQHSPTAACDCVE